MRTLLYFIMLALPAVCAAQNYDCLQPGVKNYYINGNGYLRGINIDSTQTNGDTITYYPFHTPRGPYYETPFTPPALDSNGGSWLGGKVTRYADGTFAFDNYWGNTVTIKTLAPTGSTWIFYSDSSTLYYQAEMLGADTMTLLGSMDSVETILITARNPSGIVTSDPLDSFEIKLSKNHGFAQVFDLYTFPYHKPDSVYRPGLDFFLDRSTFGYGGVNAFGGYSPDRNITIFKLVDFINPNDVQLHNWSVGDVFEREIENNYFFYEYYFTLDTIIGKTVAAHSVSYNSTGSEFSYVPPFNYTFHSENVTYYDSVFEIAGYGFLPESTLVPSNGYVFYFPDDSSRCSRAPLYITTPMSFGWGGLGSSVSYEIYKLNFGKLVHYLATGDPYTESDRLIFSRMAGVSCGHNAWPVGIDNINATQLFSIYPNPANDVLHITSSGKIGKIEISNLLGQVLLTAEITDNKAQIDVASLLVGCYIIRVNGLITKFQKL